MDYPMEELLVLVKELADRDTGMASTSITYEKAQQLMGAVLYCIHENELEVFEQAGEADRTELAGKNKFTTAREAYNTGFQLVTAKVRRANERYADMILDFKDYGNIEYHDTVVKGIPEFFKWYDPLLDPENHIILMDYMVLKQLQEFNGVDVIDQYLNCIRLEQKFLKQFPEEYVREVLITSEPEYEVLFINPCGIVLRKVLLCMLLGIKTSKIKFDSADYERISSYVNGMAEEALSAKLTKLLELLIKNIYQEDRELFRYLENIIADFSVELKNGAKNNTLYNTI